MSAITSPTLSPNLTRIFMPRGHVLPIWSPPCSSRPKSSSSHSPDFNTGPDPARNTPSDTCPKRAPHSRSASPSPCDVATTFFGGTIDLTRESANSACSSANAANAVTAAAAKIIVLFLMPEL